MRTRKSDLPLFVILKNGHIAASSVYFYVFNSNVFIVKKHRGLKNEYFLLKICNSLLLLQRTIAEKNILEPIFIIFYF